MSYIERVVLGDDRGVGSWLIRIALSPLSLLYCIGLRIFLSAYTLGFRKRYKLSVPVVNVGNLTFGGTGKTPAVQTIVRILVEQGKRVVVLSRGHGGSINGNAVVSDGSSISLSSAEAGDEPLLLAQSLPGVPVVVGKDRRVSGELAYRKFDPDVIVLDDGLQYWQLHRDLDIVVLNAAKPFGSGFVMPMGDLREPWIGIRRAGVILLSNSSSVDEVLLTVLKKRLSILAPDAQVFKCNHRPEYFTRVDNNDVVELEWIRGRKVLAFCGIGRPKSFTDMLKSMGASLVKSIEFTDHHRYSPDDVSMLENEHKTLGVDAVITTEKDIARLDGRIPIADVYTLGIRLEIEDSTRFAEYISKRINS